MTVAAEWMTTSLAARAARPSSSRPRPSCPTSPAHGPDPAGHLGGEAVAELGAEAVEAVVPDDLAGQSGRGIGPPARADQTMTSASGTQRRMRSTSAVPRNPVAPVTKKRLARRSRPMGTGIVYHPVAESVYHLVSETRQALPAGPVPGPGRVRAPAVRRAVARRRRDRRAAARASAGRRPPSTSDRILDAALASFATRGYDATSLDALAKGLEMTKQTILYWFPSKDAVLEAVIARSAADLSDALETALRSAGAGWVRVEAVVRSVFRLAARRPELLGSAAGGIEAGPPAATQMTLALEPLVRRASSFLEAEMDAGTCAGTTPPAPPGHLLHGDRHGHRGRGAAGLGRGAHRPLAGAPAQPTCWRCCARRWSSPKASRPRGLSGWRVGRSAPIRPASPLLAGCRLGRVALVGRRGLAVGGLAVRRSPPACAPGGEGGSRLLWPPSWRWACRTSGSGRPAA